MIVWDTVLFPDGAPSIAGVPASVVTAGGDPATDLIRKEDGTWWLWSAAWPQIDAANWTIPVSINPAYVLSRPQAYTDIYDIVPVPVMRVQQGDLKQVIASYSVNITGVLFSAADLQVNGVPATAVIADTASTVIYTNPAWPDDMFGLPWSLSGAPAGYDFPESGTVQ